MSLFLHRKNNLADVQNIFEARRNLGFGTLSYFDSNNVKIEGGSIKTDMLQLRSDNAQVDRFLVCKSNDGTVDFVDVNLGGWITSNINEIMFSDFDTTNIIFQDNNLADVAYTGLYTSLINPPISLSHLSNDLVFLRKDLNNIDIEAARVSLGLGSFAYVNPDDPLIFDQLTINGNLNFPNVIINDNPKYLHIRPNGSTYWDFLTKASVTEYGVVKLSDSYLDNSSNTAASIIAIKTMYDDIQVQLDNIGSVSLASEIQDTIIQQGIMKKANNLSELDNVVHARSNLGFTTNMERFLTNVNNNNSINVNSLIVNSNLVFESTGLTQLGSDTYLAVNNQGKVLPKNIQYASEEFAGFVFLTNDYEYAFGQDANDVDKLVLSMKGFSNFIEDVYDTNYASISNSIDPKIRALYHEYMRVDDNIRVDNPSIARDHLDLHAVAHTGDFFQLTNRPSNLSTFSNDTGFIYRESNLLDLINIDQARNNLLIGSVASYDSNNITILGGNGTFSNLVIEKHLQYKYSSGTNYQNMFLKSINPNGDSRWVNLPEATSTHKGIIQLESDHTRYDDRKASSSGALYRVYHQLFGAIRLLQSDIEDIKTVLNIQ